VATRVSLIRDRSVTQRASRCSYGCLVQTVTAFLARDPVSCWRVFTDAALLTLWVPGLRVAQVISKAKGLPEEVHFEFSSSLTYTLIYRYDVEHHEVRWEPKLGKRDGVRGFARFEPSTRGTLLTYGLEQGEARGPQERSLGDLETLVAAFTRWMDAERR
jgi:hypothetical protein